MCALASRILRPGTKFDHVLTIWGEQDIGKSLFCKDLAGADDLFNDTRILDRDTKAQMEAVEGKLVIELAELAGFSKADIEKVKAFITRAIDRERPAYGRFRKETPRTCIFIATTNNQHFLRDSTGNRRFWPVKVTRYAREQFLRDRDQLLAEAVVRLNDGEKLWIDDPELKHAVAVLNETHMEINPYAEQLTHLEGTQVGDEERVHSASVWQYLGMDKASVQIRASRDVAAAMKRLGWQRKDGLLRIGKNSKHGYFRQWRPKV
jgi:predicted P-loop ATPase